MRFISPIHYDKIVWAFSYVYHVESAALTTEGGGASSSTLITDRNSSTLPENAEELPLPLAPSDFLITEIGLISILILGFFVSPSEM